MTADPRAIAVLCSLRRKTRSTRSVAEVIGDDDKQDTANLLDSIAIDFQLVEQPLRGPWRLTEEGVAWCETHGMPVDPILYPSALQERP